MKHTQLCINTAAAQRYNLRNSKKSIFTLCAHSHIVNYGANTWNALWVGTRNGYLT